MTSVTTTDHHWINGPITDIIKKNNLPLICAYKTTSIKDVMDLMKKFSITSVPIYDRTSTHHQYIAFVSVLDIMAFIAFDIYFKRAKKETIRFEIHVPDLDRPISDLLQYSTGVHRSSLCCPSNTVRQVLNVMADGNHRLLVCDDVSVEQAKVVSQSDLVSLFLTNFKNLPQEFHNDITELGLVGTGRMLQKLVVISSQHSALEGFRRMYRQGVTAVAVVDDNGAIVGNLSSSDSRDLDLDNINICVYEQVLSYLKKCNRIRPIVSCFPNAHLETVLQQLIEGQVHRVWVVDDKYVPVGLITMTDVLRLFVKLLK